MALDTIKPSAPGALSVTSTLSKQLTLAWTAATDNLAVTRYNIRRKGVLVGFVAASELSFSDTGLAPSTTYAYSVAALDAAGNESAAAGISAKTYMVSGAVSMTWVEPTERLNGDHLYLTDIGGYQIRYRLVSAANFTTVNIPAGATTYNLGNLMGDYVFEIATYDTSGLYSDYVPVGL